MVSNSALYRFSIAAGSSAYPIHGQSVRVDNRGCAMVDFTIDPFSALKQTRPLRRPAIDISGRLRKLFLCRATAVHGFAFCDLGVSNHLPHSPGAIRSPLQTSFSKLLTARNSALFPSCHRCSAMPQERSAIPAVLGQGGYVSHSHQRRQKLPSCSAELCSALLMSGPRMPFTGIMPPNVARWPSQGIFTTWCHCVRPPGQSPGASVLFAGRVT